MQPQPVSAQSAGPSAETLYPWLTPPEVWDKLEVYQSQGQVQQYPCRCDESVNRLMPAHVKSDGLKVNLNVFPDAVAVREREPITVPLWLYLLMRAVFFILSIPLLLFALPVLVGYLFALFALAVLVGIPFCLVWLLIAQVLGEGLGFFVTLAIFGGAAAVLVAISVVGPKWWLDYVANLIRKNPKSWYAIKLLSRYTPTVPRCFQRGEVVQIVRCEAKSGWFSSRSLLVFVQDRPIPRGMAIVESLLCALFTRRRIYFVWLDAGEQAAEQAAKGVAQALGLDIDRATFSKRKGLQVA